VLGTKPGDRNHCNPRLARPRCASEIAFCAPPSAGTAADYSLGERVDTTHDYVLNPSVIEATSLATGSFTQLAADNFGVYA